MKIVIQGLVLLLATTFSLSQAPRKLAMKQQSECREDTGNLGIGLYVCNGGDCQISDRIKDGRITHRFTVEPLVREIDTKGPSAGKLQQNDEIISVGGSLVTSFEGGYKLANAGIGVPIELRIRRNKREIKVQVVPGTGCNQPRLQVIQ